MPVVLYGYETWSLTLSGERRLRVYENRVFKRIFGPKRDKVILEYTKLHNEELYALYCSPRKIRWAGHVARMGERIVAYRVLVGKPEERRSLGRSKHIICSMELGSVRFPALSFYVLPSYLSLTKLLSTTMF